VFESPCLQAEQQDDRARKIQGQQEARLPNRNRARRRLAFGQIFQASTRSTLAGVKQGKVALRKKDGSTVIVPLKRLVQSDRDYIEKAIKENPDLQFED
jgi:lipopolysaccharide biosynthesis regulator YciM